VKQIEPLLTVLSIRSGRYINPQSWKYDLRVRCVTRDGG